MKTDEANSSVYLQRIKNSQVGLALGKVSYAHRDVIIAAIKALAEQPNREMLQRDLMQPLNAQLEQMGICTLECNKAMINYLKVARSAGFIEAKVDGEDRKRNVISLTELGFELLEYYQVSIDVAKAVYMPDLHRMVQFFHRKRLNAGDTLIFRKTITELRRIAQFGVMFEPSIRSVLESYAVVVMQTGFKEQLTIHGDVIKVLQPLRSN